MTKTSYLEQGVSQGRFYSLLLFFLNDLASAINALDIVTTTHIVLQITDGYRIKKWTYLLLLVILPMALFLVSCEQWQDPTANLSTRSFPELDSLKNTSKQLAKLEELPVVDQLDSLLVWATLLKNHAVSEALFYSYEASNIAIVTNRPQYQAIGRYYMALFVGREQLYEEGLADPLSNARISQDIWGETDNHYWQADAAYLLGELFYRQDAADSARYYFAQGLDKLEKITTKDKRYFSLKGNIYYGQGLLAHDYDSLAVADKFYALALENYHAAENDAATMVVNQRIAGIKSQKGQIDSAIYLLRTNIENAQQKQDNYALYNGYLSLGELYFDQYKSTADTTWFNQSNTFFRLCLTAQEDNFYYTYGRIANLMYLRLSKGEQDPVYIDSALIYYDSAVVNARQEGALGYFKKMSGNLTRLCDWLGSGVNGRNCNDFFAMPVSNYLNVNYSGVVDTIKQNLTSANDKYLSFDRQFRAVKNEQRINNLRYFGLGAFLVAGLLFLWLYQRQKNKRLAARMEALRAQINPHFFSNSLNAIESLVNLDQRKAASKYLIHFSRLTRRILNSSLEATTTLAGELETTKHFLILEQLRFKDKLHYEFAIAKDIDPKQIEVPALIFQPYLENAIWHGIKPKTEPSTLLINIYREHKELICEIEDDGIGREAAARQQANTLLQKKSVGMKITKERLFQFGGGKVNVIDLYDEESNACGTRVVLRLPFKKK